MKTQVHYARYGARYTEEFDTLKDALDFIEYQEEHGEIWALGATYEGMEYKPGNPADGTFLSSGERTWVTELKQKLKEDQDERR
jgi:hypothetical protein